MTSEGDTRWQAWRAKGAADDRAMEKVLFRAFSALLVVLAALAVVLALR